MTAFTARAGGIIGRAGRRTAGAPRTSVAVLVATRIDADAGLTVLPAPAFVLILAHGVVSPYQSHWQDVWACAWAVNNATEKTNVLKASPVNLLLAIVFFMVSPHFADKNSGWLIVIIQGSGSDRLKPPESTPVRIYVKDS